MEQFRLHWYFVFSLLFLCYFRYDWTTLVCFFFLVFGHNELYLILKGSVAPCDDRQNGGNYDEDRESPKVFLLLLFRRERKRLQSRTLLLFSTTNTSNCLSILTYSYNLYLACCWSVFRNPTIFWIRQQFWPQKHKVFIHIAFTPTFPYNFSRVFLI
jgi:hypothetical protein